MAAAVPPSLLPRACNAGQHTPVRLHLASLPALRTRQLTCRVRQRRHLGIVPRQRSDSGRVRSSTGQTLRPAAKQPAKPRPPVPHACVRTHARAGRAVVAFSRAASLNLSQSRRFPWARRVPRRGLRRGKREEGASGAVPDTSYPTARTEAEKRVRSRAIPHRTTGRPPSLLRTSWGAF